MTDVETRARRGVRVLLVRQIPLHVLTFSGGVILARTLLPAQFGLYAIASFVVNGLGLLSDMGVAASLIQRRAELTPRDLRVAFTLQQLLTLVAVSALMVAAPTVAALYPHAPRGTDWLIRALSVTLYLTSWRAMGVLQLERDLRFRPVARIEVVEVLSYQVAAVALALCGFGVWSLVVAVLLRGVVGTLLVYAAAPWPLGLAFDLAGAREVLRFGIPFQLQVLADNASSWVTPTLVAGVIGPQAVGYLGWSSSVGRKPLVLVSDVMRVAYPHLCRVQDDRPAVERTIAHYLAALLLPGFLWTVLLAVAGPELVALVYTARWLPAVTALQLFAAGVSADSAAWILTVALNALGHVGFTTRVVVGRSITTLALGVVLVLVMGFDGVAMAYALGSALTLPLLLRGLDPGTARRLTMAVGWTILPATLSAAAGLLTLRLPVRGAAGALVTSAVIVAVFGGATLALCPRWMRVALSRALEGLGRRRRSSLAAIVGERPVPRGTPRDHSV